MSLTTATCLLFLVAAVRAFPAIPTAACASSLEVLWPPPNSIVRSFGVLLRLRTVDGSGKEAPVPHGRLCYVADGESVCAEEDARVAGRQWVLQPPRGTSFPDGQVTLRVFVEANPALLPAGCEETLVATVSFEYKLAHRNGAAPEGFGIRDDVTMDIRVADYPLMVNALHAITCARRECGDDAFFLSELGLAVLDVHPAPARLQVLPPLPHVAALPAALHAHGAMRVGMVLGVDADGTFVDLLLSEWLSAWVVLVVDAGGDVEVASTASVWDRWGAKLRGVGMDVDVPADVLDVAVVTEEWPSDLATSFSLLQARVKPGGVVVLPSLTQALLEVVQATNATVMPFYDGSGCVIKV